MSAVANTSINYGIDANFYNTSYGPSAVAIGTQSGRSQQGGSAIAIGLNSGMINQGSAAVAIGAGAGYYNQGYSSVAIGYNAGSGDPTGATGLQSQHDNTIILNATSEPLTSSEASGIYVAPVRSDSSPSNVLHYNTTTKEITYGEAPATFDSDGQILQSTTLWGGATGFYAVESLNHVGTAVVTTSSPYRLHYFGGGDFEEFTVVYKLYFYNNSTSSPVPTSGGEHRAFGSVIHQMLHSSNDFSSTTLKGRASNANYTHYSETYGGVSASYVAANFKTYLNGTDLMCGLDDPDTLLGSTYIYVEFTRVGRTWGRNFG